MNKSFVTLLLVLVLCVFLGVEGFKKGEKGKSKQQHVKKQQSNLPPRRPDDVKIEVTYRPEQCDTKTRHGDKVSMDYTGMLVDNTVFDSSMGKAPFTFVLGVGQVIPGWDRGLLGMCVGERRRLTIPPHYAYGDAGYPPVIPPAATLIFDTELKNIESQ